ncbi:MAG: glutamate decarboxylase [Bacillota bacterium]|nr:glutamate decarboxylase [Bacillota bacterium]
MLTVVHIAPNREAAEAAKARLEEEGLLVVVRAVEEVQRGERRYYEVLVPQGEAEEALAILNASRQL